MTPIQDYVQALGDLLADARRDLDEHGWATFVSISCEAIGIEAGKLLLLELEDDEAAA